MSSRTTRIFCVSTLYGAATLAAAIDSGCFREQDGREQDGGEPARRLLLVFNNSATPEVTPPVDEMPGFEPLRGHFDAVLSWNEAIRPFHPGAWTPRSDWSPRSAGTG